jgi:hypothetical protein
VSSYEVALNGNVQTTVAGNITAATLSGLSPATTYDVMVHASDTAGNSTPVGLSVQAITANAPVGITDQEVMSALQPTCQACHSPWFSSVGAFQSNVVANPTVLTPGDPDGSLIIQYMEENGPTSGQMPPVFFTMEGDSYLDMSNKGETLLTVQEIRDWIAAM